MTIVKPTYDLMFKKILAEEGNQDVLTNFIQDVTNQPFTNVKVSDPYTITSYMKQASEDTKSNQLRTTILDVSATTKEGVDVIIEMQLYPHAALTKRFLYYISKKYTENYTGETISATGKRINPYSQLKPIISICICNFNFENSPYIHDIIQYQSLRTGKSWCDKQGRTLIETHILNLTANTIHESDSPMINYCQEFWKDGKLLPNSPAYLQKALAILDYNNLTGKERDMVDWKNKAEADYYAVLVYREEQGYEKGMLQGLAEGQVEGRAELIRQLAKSMSTEQIAAALDMSPSDINAILIHP